MTDQRTKARLAMSEFQSASRAKVEAERDFEHAFGTGTGRTAHTGTQVANVGTLDRNRRRQPAQTPRGGKLRVLGCRGGSAFGGGGAMLNYHNSRKCLMCVWDGGKDGA